MSRHFYLVCLCVALISHVWSVDAKKGIEQKLWESFGRTSDQNSYRPSPTVKMSLGVQLVALSNFDPETSSLVVSYYLRQFWNDSSISWDKKKFNVTKLSLPSDKIWLPDIVPYRAEFHEKVFDNEILVANDGKVIHIPYYRTRVTCQLESEKRFPERICTIKFGSWTSGGFRLNITKRDKLDLTDASFTGLEESGWSFVNGNITYKAVYYPCCVEPYPHISLTLRIRQKSQTEEEEPEDRSNRKTRKPKKCLCKARMEEEEDQQDRGYRQKQPPRNRRRRYPKRRRMEEEWDEMERCDFP